MCLNRTARVGIAASIVILAHLALKVPGLGRANLWLDEAVSVHFAQLEPARLVRAVQHDTNPPLYYLLLSAWERFFGSSEAAMRWPSALASALTGGALFLIARRVGGRFVAWCSAAIFFASAANLYFAHQARPYALATFLCCLAFGVLLRLLERPTWPSALALAVVNALACSTHYMVVLAVPAQILALLIPWRGWVGLRRFVLAHAVVGVLVGFVFIPWFLPQARAQLEQIGEWRGANVHQVLGLLGWYAGRSVPLFFTLFAAGIASVAIARRSGPVPWGTLAPVLLWGIAPIVLAVAVSPWLHYFHERYLLYVTPGLALALALTLSLLPAKVRVVAGAAAALTLALRIGLGAGQGAPAYAWRAAAAAVRAQRADMVLIVPDYEYVTFAYYFDPKSFQNASQTVERLRAGHTQVVANSGQMSSLALAHVRRLTLVASSTAGTQIRERIDQELRERGFTIQDRRELDGVTVLALEQGPSARLSSAPEWGSGPRP